MPEGPECHRTAINLHTRRAGTRLIGVDIVDGRYRTHGPFQGYDKLQEECKSGLGLEVLGVATWGKLIIWIFEKGIYLHCTLGLKGAWSKSKRKHSGVCLIFDGGREWFDDQLHYGTLKVCDKEQTIKKLLSLGPDVCRPQTGLTFDYFQQMLTKRANWDISKLLMDQSALAGLGNYLKSDALYVCKIHPCSRCGTVPLAKQAELFVAITDLSVGHLDCYKRGRKMRKLVYGKKRDAVGNTISKVKTGDKRNTHYVSSVQVLYE